jgi:YVTN family beta-propeller protein
MSMIIVASKSVIAQSIETTQVSPKGEIPEGGDPEGIAVNTASNKIYILNPTNGTVTVIDSKSGTIKNIPVGLGSDSFCPYCIGVDSWNNKIYVANSESGTVSVIDGNNDTVKDTLQVGSKPTFVLVVRQGNMWCCKIYVANTGDNTVSIIDGNNDTVKKPIQVGGNNPTFMLHNDNTAETYVASDDAVSVLDWNTDTVKKMISLSNHGGGHTLAMTFASNIQQHDEVYLANSNGIYLIDLDNRTVKLNGPLPKLATVLSNYTLSSAFLPSLGGHMVDDSQLTDLTLHRKIYVSIADNATVSVVRLDCPVFPKPCIFNQSKPNYIQVGEGPGPIAINYKTRIVYLGYPKSGTVSVIKAFTDKIAVGVIFNVNPFGSGTIICGNREYPTNTYIYVDSGTNCTAKHIRDSEFSTWVESPLTNRNSSTPIEPSGAPENITIDRFGIFSANFKLPHPLSSQELFTYLTGAISAAVAINGVIVLVPGWRRAKEQRTHLRECIEMIDHDFNKSHENAIEDKIMGYYVEGKLSEDHRQLLKDKISEYYGSVKGAERYGAPF